MPVETVDRLARGARRRGGARLAPRSIDFFAKLLAPTGDSRERLYEAMRHAAIGGGKRLRPLLTIAAARLFAIDPRARAARRLRDRGDPRLFADPRRSAVHGRCRSAARQADRAQGVRRGRGGACRRQPPRAGVRNPRPSGDPRGSVGPLRSGARAGARGGPGGHGGRADDGPRRRGPGSSTCPRSPGCSS